jgi:hypothetical protein
MRYFTKALLACSGLMMATAPAYAATVFTTTLSGLNEIPNPVITTGRGTATVALFNASNSIRITGNFQNLSSPTLFGHLHCCVPRTANTPVAIEYTDNPAFPLGVTSGSFDVTYDLLSASTYSTAFLNNNGGTAVLARAALILGLNNGLGYINIHTIGNRGGELRGQLAGIPEPASWGMMIVGFGFAGGALRRRRQSVRVTYA